MRVCVCVLIVCICVVNSLFVCVYVYLHTCVCLPACVCVHAYVHVCVCACVCVGYFMSEFFSCHLSQSHTVVHFVRSKIVLENKIKKAKSVFLFSGFKVKCQVLFLTFCCRCY